MQSDDAKRSGTDEHGVPTLPSWIKGDRPETPRRIGRFRLQEKLGEGGMGEVWAADDDKLARRVALKLVRRDRVGAEQETRLLREARTLAQLSHPNVVTVHDAGEEDDFVFIAMELVEGGTLRDAFAKQDRAWRQRLRLLLQAGQGLGAAHALGLVHRDFKPANALLGQDDRVRVADFGLARVDGSADGVALEDATSVNGPNITVTGAVLGTPAYMSPEQRLGEAVTAASDQFSFCVVTWEALYGVHPFDGVELAAWISGTVDVQSPEATRDLPRGIETALRRGMAADPAKRYGSMRPLLDILQRHLDPPKRWKSVALAASAFAAVGAGAYALSERPPTCPPARDAIRWDDARRASVANALEAAPQMAALARDGLDRYADRWASQMDVDCQAVHRGNGSAWQAVRAACLAEAHAAFASTVDTLLTPADAVHRSVPDLLAELPRLERCGDQDWLQSKSARAPTAEHVAAQHALELELASIVPLRAAGRFDDARARLEALLARATELDHGPTLARVHALEGAVLEDLGDYEPSTDAFRVAYNEAERGGDTRQAAAAAAKLAGLTAAHLEQPDRAQVWFELARDRLPTELADPLHGDVALAEGLIAFGKNELFAAQRALERAVEHRRKSSRTSPDGLSTALLLLAEVHSARGDVDGANEAAIEATLRRRETYGQAHPKVGAALIQQALYVADTQDDTSAIPNAAEAVRILQAALGDAHPHVGQALDSLAGLEARYGRLDDAKKHYVAAAAVLERARGPRSATYARTLGNHASLLNRAGEYDAALPMAERALEINRQALGPDHLQLAYDWLHVAIAEENLGRFDAAADHYQQALALRERVLGPKHGDVAVVRSNLGFLERKRGQPDRARAYFEAALSIDRAALQPQHPDLLYSLVPLAELDLEADDLSGAAVRLTEARAIVADGHVDPSMAGDVHKTSAQLHHARGANAEARSSVQAAVEAYRRVEQNESAEAVLTWARERDLADPL
ncbi:MAG: serine/threonine-protein kinase [Myxococcota bacterium]